MDWDAILMAVNSDPTKPLNEGGVKIVKSVQRGVGSATSIAISEVKPDKCMALIDGITTSSSPIFASGTLNTGFSANGVYTVTNGGATLESITENTITISNVKNTYSWQLIEFY